MRIALLVLCGCPGSNGPVGEDPSVFGSLAAHNAVRAEHDVPALTYDSALADAAAAWIAELDTQGCPLIHQGTTGLGENLYWTSATATPEQVVGAWAGEIVDYDYDTNSCTPDAMCGHYTQVVWASTERVGCAKRACASGGEIWMCTYDPPGNYVGERPY